MNSTQSATPPSVHNLLSNLEMHREHTLGWRYRLNGPHQERALNLAKRVIFSGASCLQKQPLQQPLGA